MDIPFSVEEENKIRDTIQAENMRYLNIRKVRTEIVSIDV